MAFNVYISRFLAGVGSKSGALDLILSGVNVADCCSMRSIGSVRILLDASNFSKTSRMSE